MNDISISNEKNRIDIDLVVNYLSKESYWAKGRKRESILKSIENSLCFAMYKGKQQIGFARVVTDYAVFAWVMDVFIVTEFRGNGYGESLIDSIINHPKLTTISRWGLNTLDAHGLYQKYGFKAIDQPEIYMEKLIKQE